MRCDTARRRAAASKADAVFDWNCFINSRKPQLFVALFGRNGVRVFYVIIGAGIAGFGAAMATGMLDAILL